MLLSERAKHEGLIIVDLQNDFCPGGSLAVEGGDEIVGVINSIAPSFPVVVATKDWHPAGHVSFASSHTGKQPFESVSVSYGEQVLWPDHCVQGSPGAEFHPALDLKPVNLVLHKGTRLDLDSYSAFFENDHATPTGLDGYLRGLGIRHIVVCGIATDVCVFFSVTDALRLGYEVSVVQDAVRGVDQPEGSVSRALDTMRTHGARVVAASEL